MSNFERNLRDLAFLLLVSLGWAVLMTTIILGGDRGLYWRMDYQLHHSLINPYATPFVNIQRHILLFLAAVFVGIILADIRFVVFGYLLGMFVFTPILLFVFLVLPAFIVTFPPEVLLGIPYRFFSDIAMYYIAGSMLIQTIIESILGMFLGFFLSEMWVFR